VHARRGVAGQFASQPPTQAQFSVDRHMGDWQAKGVETEKACLRFSKVRFSPSSCP